MSTRDFNGMHRHRLTRDPTRRTLALAGIALATLLAVSSCSGSGPVASEHDHGSLVRGEAVQGPDGLWRTELTEDGSLIEVSQWAPSDQASEEQRQAADSFARSAQAAARRFSDRNAAFAEGYVNVDGIDPYHYANKAFINDGVQLDPERPEFVMYDPETSEFLGVMFLAPVGVRGEQIGGPLTVWHYHPAMGDMLVCWDGALPVDGAWDPTTETCRSGEQRAGSPDMLHVWAIPNALGPFGSDMVPVGSR
jgi:hypothetical protein